MELLEILTIPKDDPVAFTFFTGYMAMMAAAVFFFFERGSVEGKWRLSLVVSGLITGIAARIQSLLQTSEFERSPSIYPKAIAFYDFVPFWY